MQKQQTANQKLVVFYTSSARDLAAVGRFAWLPAQAADVLMPGAQKLYVARVIGGQGADGRTDTHSSVNGPADHPSFWSCYAWADGAAGPWRRF